MNRNNQNLTLYISLIASLFVVLKMYTGNNMYLVIFLLVILCGMLVTRASNRIEYLLFFISWVYVIKFDISQTSLYVFLSLLYLILSVLFLFKTNAKMSGSLLLNFLVFLSYVMLVSSFRGGNLVEYIGFLINYTVLFFAVIIINKSLNNTRYIKMYAWGLLVGGYTRILSYYVNEINQYIESMGEVNTVYVSGNLSIRFAGLDIDPNYYAAQVLIAISALLVVIYKDQRMNLFTIFMIISLSIFGLLTFSKMFMFTFATFLLLACLAFFKNSIKKGLGYLVLLLVISFYLYFNYFDYFYDVYWARFFGSGSSIENVTTGRSEIWSMFIREIFDNITIFLFGTGYGTGFLNEKVPHNMYLTAFYYMGVTGIVIVVLYIVSLFQSYRHKMNKPISYSFFSVAHIPIYILLISNLTLDSFIMDYFPLQLLVIMSCLFMVSKQ